ncbi:S8 family serine peptidase [Nonomuraea sp. B12E4]|uniref:S8 family peptidase n=1 Tax=Nonomuraea sp. B12E4 TaxID=3153564 RepID=UPI00325E4264
MSARLWRWAAVAACVTSTLATGHGTPALADGAPAPRPAATPADYDLTLITGDQVHVTTGSDGHEQATVTPAARGGGRLPSGFRIAESGGELSVIPDDMAPLIPRLLDPELFNVTALAEQGHADDQGTTIPLILSYRDTAATKAAIPAVKPLRTLESIGAAGVSVDKAKAAELGTELARLAGADAATVAASPLNGVSKIWLDHKAEATLDHSVPQIGAPAAWQAGYDGTGTTVAVIDSGIDTGHPDLAGKVVGERDFTGLGDTRDAFGHGTHVADTIAGSGAASDGRLKGVAPGVSLLNARVLDAVGEGYSSGIIEAMEWAAGEKHADIVNMSLGIAESDGPVTEAVGRLTQQYGTLFVVAAGNNGCGVCVLSPGDAPDALTVGAVDAEDERAEFSDYGPVGMRRAVKPDVTAPGVGIVAARAGGTGLGEPVDDHYTRVSGTSMATPHVAGAAALLRQARPGVTGAELKALLMGTAKPHPGTSVDQQGTGRIDVAKAIAEPVLASSGVLDFGVSAPSEEVTRRVTYRNPGAEPVTARLTASGPFTVSAAELTVPAGGTATAEVALDAKEQGPLRGELVATAGDGASARTLLTGNVERRRARLHVTAVARDGRPAAALVNVVDVDNGMRNGLTMPTDPVQHCPDEAWYDTCLLVPPGTYSVFGPVRTLRPEVDSRLTGDRGDVLNTTLAGDPEVRVEGDTDVVLDARRGTEVEISTPDHRDARANPGGATKFSWHRAPVKGEALDETFLPAGNAEQRMFVTPTKRVTKGEFTMATRWRLEAPEITMTAPGVELDAEYYDPVWFSDFSDQFPRLEGTARLTAVDAGRGRPQDLAGRDLRGRLAVIRRTEGVTVAAQSNAAARAGARMVAIYSDRPGIDATAGGEGVTLAVPTVRLSHEAGRALVERLRRRPVTVRAEGITASPYAYDLDFREEGRVPDRLRYEVRTKSLARVESSFHSQATADLVLSEVRYAWQPWETFSVDVTRSLRHAPRTRVDYLTADPDVRWSAAVEMPERPYNYAFEHPDRSAIALAEPVQRAFRPGERAEVSWFRQPLLPETHPAIPIRREGDLLKLDLQGYVDADGHPGVAASEDFPAGKKTDFRLYQGQKLLTQTGRRPQGTLALPPESTPYRIVYDLTNRATWARLSTRTHTEWTFTSARPASGTQVIPLLFADLDIAADLENRVGSQRIGLSFHSQQGASTGRVRDVSLEVSYDDGVTWRPVRRLRDKGGNAFEATLDRPPAHGFASLRLKATGQAGATLHQEVIRAYALR